MIFYTEGRGGKAILANLTYQFFGKTNDTDTAKYYQDFFEIIKEKTISVSSSNSLKFDSRITTSKKDVAKIRAFEFFKLKAGEFVVFSDGVERKVRFLKPKIQKNPPPLFANLPTKNFKIIITGFFKRPLIY